MGDLQLCPVPRHVQAVQVDGGNEQDLLTLVVEGDHGVKEHQVKVPERIRILDGNLRRWFRVLDGIVGEPADESSRKGRHAVDPGASVPVHDLPQLDDRIPSLEFQVLDVHDVIDAGDFHTGLIPQKAPAAPGAVFFGALQQIYVAGHVFQDPEGFHGGDEVRKNGCSHGHGVKSQGSISFCIFICGETVHDRLLSMKKIPDRKHFCQGRIFHHDPRCHPGSWQAMRLRDTDISPDLYGVLPSQNTPATRFTAPSAVHLTAGS